jgi:hypothetical protein
MVRFSIDDRPSNGESSSLRAVLFCLLVLLPLLAASVPPAFIAVTVARHAINVPFGHTWEIVRHLNEAHEGELRFKHLWSHSIANRPILPRVVMLAVAWATDMNLRYGLAANFIVALGVFALLVLLIWRTARPLAPAQTPWIILAASLIIFSPAQSLNWAMVWQILAFMNALAAVGTVCAIARWGQRPPGPALAILCAVAGTFSYSAGLILLAIVPLGLLLAPRHHSGPKRILSPAVALAVAVIVASLYLMGLDRPLQRASPSFLFHHPLLYGHYVLVYMGAPLGFHNLWAATLWGAVGMMTFAWCGVWLWRCSPAHRQAVMPWFLLALYATLSGFMTGAGRLDRGVAQALVSRYILYSSLFWVSLVVVGALAIAHYVRHSTVLRATKLAAVLVVASLVILGAVSYGKSWTRGMISIKRRHHKHVRGGECLLYYERAPDKCLQRIRRGHGSRSARKLARLMEKLAIGPFAPSEREWFSPLYVRATRLESERAGRIDQVTARGATASRFRDPDDLILSGWAIDPVTRGLPAAVLIVVDGKLVGRAKTRVRRPDVAKALSQKELLHLGWMFRLDSLRLDPGSHLFEAYALLNDHRRIVKLVGARRIEVIK